MNLIPFLIFVALATLLYVGLQYNPQEIDSTRLDKPAPAFAVPKLLTPEETITEKVFIGKVSLFNAWASWCNSCRYEHPLLMQLATQTDIPIYGLNYKDERSDARRRLQREGNPYAANAFDNKGLVGIEWGLTGTPETFVIDQQGIVRYKHTGPLTAEVIKEVIFPLIDKLEQQTKSSK